MLSRRALLIASPTLLAATEAQAASEKKKSGGQSYVPLRTLTATVTKPGGRMGVLTVEAGLDAPDDAVRTRAAASVPRLRAAYFTVLQAYATGMRPGSAPDADYLSRELQRATDRVVGKPGARVVLGTILVN
jgi:hypothetical protein